MSTNIFKNFAEITLSTYNLKNLNIDDAKAIAALSKEIESEYLELNSDKVKTARLKHFNISDVEEEHYAEHLLEIDEARKVICGIRHLGEQPDNAFVHMLTNFKTTKAELLEIYKYNLSKYFEPFNPKYLRYYAQQKAASNQIRNSYLVQHAAVIKEGTPFELEKDINLISSNSTSYYYTYEKEYEKFHIKNPDFKHTVQANGLALMETSRKAGLLKQLVYKDETIGLIAGLKDDFLGHPGIYFIEILVYEGWKRKGFAKAMQRKYINEICKGDEIVWGTIDWTNKASLKTAKANLREERRYEHFVKIES